MNAIIFSVVWRRPYALSEGISGIPVDWEVDSGIIRDACVCDGVLAQPRLAVDTNRVALVAVVGLRGKILGVC